VSANRTILCADDYAMTLGVSTGIEELARVRRLSATSAMVTIPHWPTFGPRVRELRRHVAVGLHFNLTLGRPLGPMPKFAAAGRFGAIGDIIKRGALGALPQNEIEAELIRQLDQFEAIADVQPDFIDGHQHVHALPGVRSAFLAAIGKRSWLVRPLIRDPADKISAITARAAVTGKSLMLAGLSRGFGAAVRTAGFPTNDGFSGASAFDERMDFGEELERFLSHPGSRHLVMCHPGHIDAELPTLDPVVGRREQEYAALMVAPDLPERIWHSTRAADGTIDWSHHG
jgi:chitin disaccharide deacetylase